MIITRFLKQLSHGQRIALVVAGVGVIFLLLVITEQSWRAISLAVVALFGALVLLAVYFWGSLLFGGVWDYISRQRSPVPWSIGASLTVPQHNLDPGLELLAAGILVYRLGEVKPHLCFRRVPLANARSLRPFIAARTGAERGHSFHFVLYDEKTVPRFEADFSTKLGDSPRIVMPPFRLSFDRPRQLVGQRWTLQVRSGVTVVTTFRFMFVEGSGQAAAVSALPLEAGEPGEPVLDWQQDLLPRLLDEALKQDFVASTQEIVLEER